MKKNTTGGHWTLPKFVTDYKGLSLEAKFVFAILWTRANGDNIAWPGQRYIAEQVGCSTRSVRRYTEELVKNGLIEKVRSGRNKTNRYLVKGMGQIVLSGADSPVLSGADTGVLSIVLEQNKRTEVLAAKAAPAKEKLELLRETVEHYKRVKGFDRVAGWDKVNYQISSKYAKQLIGLIRENFKSVTDWSENDMIVDVKDCINTFQRWGEITGLSWTLATVVRRFGEYMRGMLDQEIKSRESRKQKIYA